MFRKGYLKIWPETDITKLSQFQMEVTKHGGLFYPQIIYFQAQDSETPNEAIKRLCPQVILLPKAHTQRKQIYTISP